MKKSSYSSGGRYVPHQQSDLRLFERLESLHPAHVIALYNGLHRRTRAILICMIAALVLMWSLSTIIGLVTAHIENTRGPFLTDALAAPYQLSARPLAPTGVQLPSVVGFTLAGTLDDAQLQALEVDVATTNGYALGHCLAAKPLMAEDGTTTHPCALTLNPVTTTSSQFSGGAALVSVTNAQFMDNAAATVALNELFRHARTIGETGNFAMAVTDVDYFYSMSNGVYSFSWSHDFQLYTASSTDFATLEAWLRAFPY